MKLYTHYKNFDLHTYISYPESFFIGAMISWPPEKYLMAIAGYVERRWIVPTERNEQWAMTIWSLIQGRKNEQTKELQSFKSHTTNCINIINIQRNILYANGKLIWFRNGNLHVVYMYYILQGTYLFWKKKRYF